MYRALIVVVRNCDLAVAVEEEPLESETLKKNLSLASILGTLRMSLRPVCLAQWMPPIVRQSCFGQADRRS